MEAVPRVEVRRAGDRLVTAGGAPLDVGAGRLVVEIRSVPGEPGFDAPASAAAAALAELLAGRDHDVTVASRDWFAIEAARDAGLRTAFVTPPGLALDAALTYVTEARHAECQPHWSAVAEDPSAVAKAHAAGVTVVPWGVGGEAMRALGDSGVDGVLLDDD